MAWGLGAFRQPYKLYLGLNPLVTKLLTYSLALVIVDGKILEMKLKWRKIVLFIDEVV